MCRSPDGNCGYHGGKQRNLVAVLDKDDPQVMKPIPQGEDWFVPESEELHGQPGVRIGRRRRRRCSFQSSLAVTQTVALDAVEVDHQQPQRLSARSSMWRARRRSLTVQSPGTPPMARATDLVMATIRSKAAGSPLRGLNRRAGSRLPGGRRRLAGRRGAGEPAADSGGDGGHSVARWRPQVYRDNAIKCARDPLRGPGERVGSPLPRGRHGGLGSRSRRRR